MSVMMSFPIAAKGALLIDAIWLEPAAVSMAVVRPARYVRGLPPLYLAGIAQLRATADCGGNGGLLLVPAEFTVKVPALVDPPRSCASTEMSFQFSAIDGKKRDIPCDVVVPARPVAIVRQSAALTSALEPALCTYMILFA